MDALKLAVKRPACALVLALFVAAPMSDCSAEHFDGTTHCRWSRTWHGPNSIWRPLSPYFVPRPADPCLYGGYGRSCYEDVCFAEGCGFAVEGRYFSENATEYEGENLMVYGETPVVPVGLERLGQIPNDTGIAAGAPAGAATRPGR